jgi:hypothetical protein
MATLLSAYTEIGFTILPHMLDNNDLEMLKYPGKYVIGFITYNKIDHTYTFKYTEPEGFSVSNKHWSLDILKKFPYCDQADGWVVFNCPPHKAKQAYPQVFGNSIKIDHWDSWSVEGADAKVAVITSWELA